MNPQESSSPEKKRTLRWRTIGYRLCLAIVLVLAGLSLVGFPGSNAAYVLQTSALSQLDLLKTRMAIEDELAKKPVTTDPAAVSAVFNSEGWKTLESAVINHHEHFYAIEDEKRWWDRLFLVGCSIASVGLVIFGRLQDKEVDRHWDDNLPKGSKHLGRRPPAGSR